VINIFDVRTGKVMRDFKGSADEFSIGGAGGVAGVSWPVFRWFFFSHDICSPDKTSPLFFLMINSSIFIIDHEV